MSPPPANGPGTRKSKGMDSPATLKRDSHMPPRTRRAISKTQKIPRGNTPFAGLQGDDAGPSAVFGNGFLDTLAARFRQSGKRTADASDFCLPEHQGLVHPLARAVELDESSMVDHPVDHRGGKLVVAQDRSPFAELDVGGEHHASLLVAC